MVKILVVRHGFSQSNLDGTFTGHIDAPLTDLGLKQGKLVSDYIYKNYKIDAIYSSDLSRATDTARPIAEVLQLPINLEKDLREINAGDWQGRKMAEIRRDYPEEFIKWMSSLDDEDFGDKESRYKLRNRSIKVFEKIAEENEGKTVLIATHYGVIKSIQQMWLPEEEREQKIFSASNASVSVIQYNKATKEAKFVVKGYDEHLK